MTDHDTKQDQMGQATNEKIPPPNNLYQVQDGDRPMFVLAPTYHLALVRWAILIHKENRTEWPCPEAVLEMSPPDGVTLIAKSHEIIQ